MATATHETYVDDYHCSSVSFMTRLTVPSDTASDMTFHLWTTPILSMHPVASTSIGHWADLKSNNAAQCCKQSSKLWI